MLVTKITLKSFHHILDVNDNRLDHGVKFSDMVMIVVTVVEPLLQAMQMVCSCYGLIFRSRLTQEPLQCGHTADGFAEI